MNIKTRDLVLDLFAGLCAFVLCNVAFCYITNCREGLLASVALVYLLAGFARGQGGKNQAATLLLRTLLINAPVVALAPVECYAPTTLLLQITRLFPTVFQFPLAGSILFTIGGLFVRAYCVFAGSDVKVGAVSPLLLPRLGRSALHILCNLLLFALIGTLLAVPSKATLLRGPYLQSVTSDSVWVVWDTAEPSVGRVEYGSTPRWGQVVTEEQEALHHQVQLTGLIPGTVYHYRVDNKIAASFRTAPVSRQASLRFAVVGDTRTSHRIHKAIVARIVDAAPDLVVHVGDLVESGHDTAQWDMFFWIEAPLLRIAPFYPALGGHEENAPQYFEHFVLPNNERWYAFDYGPARFIALKVSDYSDPTHEQLTWLRRQLAANEAPWLFVYFHVPVYTSHGEDDLEIRLRRKLVPLCEEYGVDVVFMGHQHSYERIMVNGVTYVVTAGGGAPLYKLEEPEPGSQVAARAHHFLLVEVSEGRLTGTAINRYGQIIDGFELPADR